MTELRADRWRSDEELRASEAKFAGILAIAANAQKLTTPTGVDLSLVFSQGIQPILVGFLVWGATVAFRRMRPTRAVEAR